ncbi:MAG TPA: sugar phosphate nucleotidyltransferase [Caulobacteraceae bacterium]|nr:sugar phosphate nucleotidyltransferase [Caulobacteraceae bacterium]
MRLYPVILSGGSGTRLWPLSGPQRPKQFIPLVDSLSSFQRTALRAAGLPGVERLVVVAGEPHLQLVVDQLKALNLEADVLLEPGPRDSAAAVAAAAAWIARTDEDAVVLFLSSDNYFADEADFASSAGIAADAAGQSGIVSLGMQPRSPSPAYGYIVPSRPARLSPILRFVEKPDEARAGELISEGALWNSGIFAAGASMLLQEFRKYAPETLAAVETAISQAAVKGRVIRLGEAFLYAPRRSIDYALLEKTAHASVLRVAFQISDLGAWSTVWRLSPKDGQGNRASDGAVLIDSENVLLRAPPGARVAVIGLSNVAVVLVGEDLLVCSLDHDQLVKAAVERFSAP